jgi:hypothetical protein
MSTKAKFQQVSLTDDEKDMLLTIYNKRRRFLVVVFTGLMAIAFVASFTSINARSLSAEWAKTNTPGVEGLKWIFNLLLLETIVISSGIYFYFKRALPYKRDAGLGLKEKVPYVIMRREYFPLTRQYFFAFDDPQLLHHEIDEDTYFSYLEGDTFNVFRGPKSKFVLKGDGKYSIL